MIELSILLFRCCDNTKKSCNQMRHDKFYYFVDVDYDIPEQNEDIFFNTMNFDFIICETFNGDVRKYSKKYNIPVIYHKLGIGFKLITA